VFFERLSKYLELLFTVKLPPLWSTYFEPYEGVWAKNLPDIGRFNVPYVMLK